MATRKELFQALEQARGSRLLCYFTGDRKNQETQIGDDVIPCFSEHLSTIGKVPKFIQGILAHLGLPSIAPSLRAPPDAPDGLAVDQSRAWSYEPFFDDLPIPDPLHG